MDKRIKLPYLRAQTSEKDLAKRPSSPDVETIGHHTSPGKLHPLTKQKSKEGATHDTIYVVAVGATGSCWQDI